VDFISFSLRITLIPCPPFVKRIRSLIQPQYALNSENQLPRGRALYGFMSCGVC
jgi:hypothetical protein